MALFPNDIDIFRRFVAVSVNYSLDDVLPELERITQEVLERFLGEALTEQLIELAEATWPLTVLQQKALNLARRCVARLGLTAHLPLAEVQIGDDGVTVSGIDGRKPAFEYQLRNIKRELTDSGWRALDELIALIAKNSTDFPGWQSAPYKDEYESALFKSPVDFSRYYPIQDRWLTFWALRPAVLAIEEGQAAGYLARIEQLAEESDRTRLTKALKRAVAYQGVIDSLPTLSIELNGSSVQVNYASQYGNVQYFQPPSPQSLTWVMDNLKNFANLAWNLVDTDLGKLESGPGETPVAGSGLIDNSRSSIIML